MGKGSYEYPIRDLLIIQQFKQMILIEFDISEATPFLLLG